MGFLESGKTATLTSLFLALTIAVTMVALPAAYAHTPAWSIRTWAYINIAPNPVGVSQTASIIYWRNLPPPTAAGSGGDRWRNVMIYVTKPDGTTETLGPFTTDDVGGGYTYYTPNQVGTYNFSVSFPDQVLSLYGPNGLPGESVTAANLAYINDTFLACSAATTLTVQQEPLPPPPTFPLPTDYWTRPIEGQNTNWYTIASNWLSSPQIVLRFQPDGAAPNSAHIMWAQPYQFGGVVGGTNTGTDGMTYYTGMNYEAKFQTPIIMNGRLYYELPLGNNNRGGGFVCVDLRTGEELWRQDITGISFGQLFDYESLNQHGVVPNGFLWSSVNDPANGGTVWRAYDPLTGKWLFNETNVPSGTTKYGPNGEILIYQMNYAARWLALWNNTKEQQGLHGALGTTSSAYQWRPIGKNVNMSKAYSWNVTIPSLNGLSSPSIVYVINDDLILGTSSTFQTNAAWGQTQNPYTMWAISLKPSSRGQLLWIQNYTDPPNNMTRTLYTDPGWPNVDPTTRVFIMRDIETMQEWGYSIDNGRLLWGPTVPEISSLGFYFSTGGQFDPNIVAYGNFYRGGYGGILYCYNLTTGNLVFTYGNGGAGNSSYSGFATPYGRYTLGIGTAADGKLYLFSSEHSPTSPYWKGATIRCVDAYKGTELWTLYGYAGVGSNNGMAVADGYLVYLNAYDMQLYCIGKGPSATTVSASPEVSVHGNSVLVRGIVTDQCAGAKALAEKMGYVNGVPAVADGSMSAWMEYLYMQKPIPTNAKGVEVTLDTIDPNGNFVHIGTVTSDMSGMFKKAFAPEVPGEYTIIATFAGSKSYYSSYAETAINVDEAPPATAAPEYPQPIDPTWTIIGVGIVLLIAIILVGIWIKRK